MSADAKTLLATIEAIAKNPPQDRETRQAIYKAVNTLRDSVEDPHDTLYRILYGPINLPICTVASNLGIFDILTSSTSFHSTAQLAEQTKADPVLLGRILRYLQSHGFIAGTQDLTYGANKLTHTLKEPGFQAGLRHTNAALQPCLQKTPKFLQHTKYQDPVEALSCPFQVAHQTTQGAYDWAITNHEVITDFNIFMSMFYESEVCWLDVYDFQGRHAQNVKSDEVLWVDIAGGIGQQSNMLVKRIPDLPGRKILQDQPAIIAQAKPAPGVEKMTMNLWDEQPIKNARAYYMRDILHNYPDHKSVELLGNIKKAMGPESILFIDEMVVPEVDAYPRSTELDIVMMVCLASVERTKAMWDNLLKKAGYKVLEMKLYSDKLGKSIIVAKPE